MMARYLLNTPGRLFVPNSKHTGGFCMQMANLNRLNAARAPSSASKPWPLKVKPLALALSVGLLASQAHAISLTGWTTLGNSGTSGADGVVVLSPYGDSQYGWVSTENGSDIGSAGPNFGSETTGSIITSPLFNATTGDVLQFYFNYVTTDGAGYADYAWARLLNAALVEVAVLFTARTTPGGDTVPGFGMPPLNATLSPAGTPIVPGDPVWGPLGSDSGTCWTTGCGYTGWVQASYSIPTSGTFALQFGVVNWDDFAFQSGLAFDGATVRGIDIGNPGAVPEPTTLALLGIGMIGLLKRRKSPSTSAI